MILSVRHTGIGWRAIRRYPVRVGPAHASNELKCPTCNSINRILNGDITNLTKNFALLSCRPQVSTRKQQKSRHFCEEHDHEKRIYCNDCKTLVCAYCQLYGGHKQHDCVIATEVAKPIIEMLKTAAKTVSEDLDQVTQAEGLVNTAITRLERGRKTCEMKVKRYFGDLIKKLAARRDVLLTSAQNWSEEQMYILQAQLE